jgi:1,4-dihydroxy-2-naphthoate octaprenyltransferase
VVKKESIKPGAVGWLVMVVVVGECLLGVIYFWNRRFLLLALAVTTIISGEARQSQAP